MHKFVLFLVFSTFLLGTSLFGQGSFSDDFSDGDFSSNPNWLGETSNFQINANNQLQLNHLSPSSSNLSSLVTASNAINSATWEFYVKLDFSPSTSNFGRVYLVADQQDLTQALNGYFVQVGGQSGTVDDVSLYRQDGNSTVKIIDGVDGTVASSPEVRIRVTRSNVQQWELFLDQTATGSSFISEGTVLDSTYNSSIYFGVFCRFTSTRSDKFFFDDFIVSSVPLQDTIGPSLTLIDVSSANTLNLSFNEPLSASTALTTSNYSINKGIGNPSSIQLSSSDSSAVQLTFSTPFVNGDSYDLSIKDITDTAGNIILQDSSSFTYFLPVPAQYRDLVINELYFDFTPTNGLPESEFIELFNASNKIFQLGGWTVSDGNSTATLNTTLIRPGEFLILCSLSDTALFSPFGTTMGVSSFPTLNNDGDNIQLFDASGNLIDFANYNISWYRDPDKENGGYTLEQINPFSPCIGSSNFIASNNLIGGTPGTQNSVFDTLSDNSPPIVTDVIILSNDSITITFNKGLDSASVAMATYSITPFKVISQVEIIGVELNTVLILLENPLDSGINHSIVTQGIRDICFGNTNSNSSSIDFLLPHTANSNDVVINEVLFNPRTDGEDFIELFNRSEKVIDLSSLRIADEANIPQLITEEPFLLFPNSFTVITVDKENILHEYPLGVESRIIEIDNLPGFDNIEDTVYLTNVAGLSIDAIQYNEDQHFTLLQDVNGVSLERISPERPSTDPSNFHSASETEGFATPGYENSQAFDGIRFSGKIAIEPDIFSPDNDGFQDILSINYQFSAPGFVASISIFDRNGRLIKRLVQNELLGSSGTFSWDGITDDNLKARIGVYVVLIEAFNVNGNQEVFKEVITIAGNLD